MFLINILTNSIELIQSDLALDHDQINDFLYCKKSNDLFFIGQNNYEDLPSKDVASVYDLDSQEIIAHDFIPKLFGFVKHPDTDLIYCLTLPMEGQGFRLMELHVHDSGLSIQQKSVNDLMIDNLSSYLQTIHTASNSYICWGGSSYFDNPENYIYSINLNTGELTGEIYLENYGLMTNLEGE